MLIWFRSNSCQSVYSIALPVIHTSLHSEIRAQYLFEKETSAEKFPQYQDGTFWSNFKLGFFDYLSLLTDRSLLITCSGYESTLSCLSRFTLSGCCWHFVSRLLFQSARMFIECTEQCSSSNGVCGARLSLLFIALTYFPQLESTQFFTMLRPFSNRWAWQEIPFPF